jgi:hypothetical protein
MSVATLLQSKSVKTFFEGCNWEGKALALVAQPEIEKQPLPLCLSVGAFFQQHNWEGKAVSLTPETTVTEIIVATQTVGEFFGYMSWSGKPQVAKMPTPAAPNLETQHAHLNLDDLSDLF